jgi:hypothetical protein
MGGATTDDDAAPPPVFFDAEGTTLGRRERILLERLEEEYTPSLLRDVLKPLVTQQSPVSLRALDWCVTNYAKQHNVMCSSAVVPGQLVNVHHAYRATLGHWKRRLFDPFRRRDRLRVRIDDEVLETTLGQANFALWAYRTGVLAFSLGHVDAIEADMNAVAQRQKRERRAAARRGVRRKRTELTSAARPGCVAYATTMRVNFE